MILPTNRSTVLGAAPFMLAAILEACSGGSSSTGALAQASDAGTEEAGIPVGAFNGDCTSTRWSDVSDACWSCICGTCADTVNACNEDCLNLLWCAAKGNALVNVASDLSCESRASIQTCGSQPGAGTQFGAVTSFDGCLISAPKPDGGFRACENECGIMYSGDVCQRFPQ